MCRTRQNSNPRPLDHGASVQLLFFKCCPIWPNTFCSHLCLLCLIDMHYLRRYTKTLQPPWGGGGTGLTLSTCLLAAPVSGPMTAASEALHLKHPSCFPSKNYPGPMLLNFDVLIGKGVSNKPPPLSTKHFRTSQNYFRPNSKGPKNRFISEPWRI